MSNITFDKEGKTDIKSGAENNIEKLTLNQHLINAVIIAKLKKRRKIRCFKKKN